MVEPDFVSNHPSEQPARLQSGNFERPLPEPATVVVELVTLYEHWDGRGELPVRVHQIDAELKQLIRSDPHEVVSYIAALFHSESGFLRTEAGVLCAELAGVDSPAANQLWDLIRTDRAAVVEASLVIAENLLHSHRRAETEGPDHYAPDSSDYEGIDISSVQRFWDERISTEL